MPGKGDEHALAHLQASPDELGDDIGVLVAAVVEQGKVMQRRCGIACLDGHMHPAGTVVAGPSACCPAFVVIASELGCCPAAAELCACRRSMSVIRHRCRG